VRCDYVDPQHLNEVLNAGWNLEQKRTGDRPNIDTEEIRWLQQQLPNVNLLDIRPVYIELIQKLRNAGVMVSDRRAVKLQRLIAASALLCKRFTAYPSDLWVLKYIWDTEEQQEIIAGIVNTVIAADEERPDNHPRARLNSEPDADEIYNEIIAMTAQWEQPETSMAERAAIKDRLRYLNGRCEWIRNNTQRDYVMQPIDSLWQKIMETV
jgi:MoxR-like ATPase